MHAYLLTGNFKKVSQKVEEMARQDGRQVVLVNYQTIQEIREFKRSLSLINSNHFLYFFTKISQASKPALNAFLKILEEPDNCASFVLFSPNTQVLPETIVSRCFHLHFSDQKSAKLSDNEKEIEKFLSLKSSEKLKYIESLKARQKAVEFLENLLSLMQKQLIFTASSSTEKADKLNKIESVMTTYRSIKFHNGNTTIQLGNLFFNAFIL